MRRLADRTDEVNHTREPWAVDKLNETYRELRPSHWGIDPDLFPLGEDSPGYERARSDAKDSFMAWLCSEYNRLDAVLDREASDVTEMIKRGANPNDVAMLFREGLIWSRDLSHFSPDFASNLTYEDWKGNYIQSILDGGLAPPGFTIPSEHWIALTNDREAMTALGESLDDVDARQAPNDAGTLGGSDFENVVTYANAIEAHPEWDLDLAGNQVEYLDGYVRGALASEAGDVERLLQAIDNRDQTSAERVAASGPPSRFEPISAVFADGLRALADTNNVGGSRLGVPAEVRDYGLEELLAELDAMAGRAQQLAEQSDR